MGEEIALPKVSKNPLVNVPNMLTLLRISLIPIFVLVFYIPLEGRYLASAAVFAVAALTDWLDGFLARQLKQVSPLGEFLDPVADKLIVVVALVLLVQAHASVWLALPAAIIIGREIVISALREWMAELGKRKHVAVNVLGKWKTVWQMIAIIMLLSQKPHTFSWVTISGYVLLYAAALLTLWSMWTYLQAAWSYLVETTK